MKRKIVCLLGAITLMAAAFVGCESTSDGGKKTEQTAVAKNSIVGTWKTVKENGEAVTDNLSTYTFKDDGTCAVSASMGGISMSLDYKYEAKDGKLTMTADMGEETFSQTVEYSIDGKKMTLVEEGETIILEKQ